MRGRCERRERGATLATWKHTEPRAPLSTSHLYITSDAGETFNLWHLANVYTFIDLVNAIYEKYRKVIKHFKGRKRSQTLFIRLASSSKAGRRAVSSTGQLIRAAGSSVSAGISEVRPFKG